MYVETYTSQILLRKNALQQCESELSSNVNNPCARSKAETFYLFRGPLESSYHRVLNFVEVLYTLGAVNQYIRSAAVRSEAPDFPRLCHVVVVFLVQVTSAYFEVISRINFALQNIESLKFTFGPKHQTDNGTDSKEKEIKLTLSMSSARPSGIGQAIMNRRLCLFGDFDKHI